MKKIIMALIAASVLIISAVQAEDASDIMTPARNKPWWYWWRSVVTW